MGSFPQALCCPDAQTGMTSCRNPTEMARGALRAGRDGPEPPQVQEPGRRPGVALCLRTWNMCREKRSVEEEGVFDVRSYFFLCSPPCSETHAGDAPGRSVAWNWGRRLPRLPRPADHPSEAGRPGSGCPGKGASSPGPTRCPLAAAVGKEPPRSSEADAGVRMRKRTDGALRPQTEGRSRHPHGFALPHAVPPGTRASPLHEAPLPAGKAACPSGAGVPGAALRGGPDLQGTHGDPSALPPL